ncbi:DNA repair protein Nse1 [Penicillium citrinum]|uniref:Non-structural maintenance of chromosomes element 1 homolog n=1 Tax=Penicillium citrinum TaxID=5077 RepID=A0A9W9PC52_PENCI|nr:DNA repair protein Nse1 [Penicillium citrinum]KAJ5241746.1 DNA repair protein Nse1 [Penicillium citrinum]
MDSDYNDANRAFLQAFMARSSMTLEEAQPVLAAILSTHEGRTIDPEDITQEHFSSYISAANTAISPFDLEIRSTLRQTPKEQHQDSPDTPTDRVYALVNTTSDPLTQLATTHTADEIAFVKRVLDYMFDTNNTRICEGMAISSMQAIQQAKVSSSDRDRRQSQNPATQATQGGAAQSLSMTQAETMMRSLVEEGWLEKSRGGYFTLTPRGLMELKGWLISTYNDDPEREESRRGGRIKFCAACKEIVTVGQRCDDRECKGRLHDHCVRNYFRMQQAEKCPVCKQDWPGDKFVGERAIAAVNRRQGRNVPSGVPAGVDGADEESMEEE